MMLRLFLNKTLMRSTLSFLALTMSCAAGLVSCQSGSKQQMPANLHGGLVIPDAPRFSITFYENGTDSKEAKVTASPLSAIGENSEPSFSTDGKKVLYLSQSRPAHQHAQIYLLDLNSMHERRITFHDGGDLSPRFSADGLRILYASATDEIKEEPYVIESVMRNFYPEGIETPADPERFKVGASPPLAFGVTELYSLRLSDQDIIRLTHRPGLDGDPSSDQADQRIVYTSVQDGWPNLLIRTRAGTRRLTKGSFSDRNPRFSPNATLNGLEIVWNRLTPEMTSSQIMVQDLSAEKPRPLTPSGALDIDASWFPNGEEIIFSSNRDGKFFNLYTIHRTGQCLRRLTSTNSNQRHPAVSPDGRYLVFTGDKSGTNQIYQVELPPRATCPTKTTERVRGITEPT